MRRFCTLLLAGMMLSAVATRAPAEPVDRIEAIVNTAIITYQQLDMFITGNVLAAERQYGFQPDVLRQKIYGFQTNGLELLIQRQLILHEFDTLQNKVPESIIDKIVEDEIHRDHPDRVQYIQELRQQGKTLEQERKEVRDFLIIQELSRQNVPEPIISPHRIEAYYNDHREKYKLEDEVKTRMIVVNQSTLDDPGTAKKRCEEILSQIKGGATFEEMAKVYSDSPTKNRGAVSDWLEVGKLAEGIRAAIGKIKPGECSEVVEGKEACFLVELVERRPTHYTPLNEVRDDIEKTLLTSEQSRLRKKWVDRLRKKTFVRTF